MKKIFLILGFMSATFAGSAEGRVIVNMLTNMRISDVAMARRGDMLVIEMSMLFEREGLRNNYATIYTPRLNNGKHELELLSVGVFGRNHYFADRRADISHYNVPEDWQLRRRDLPAEVSYYVEVEYAEWMNGATLVVDELYYGCCNALKGVGRVVVAEFGQKDFAPQYIYVEPHATTTTQWMGAAADIYFELQDATLEPTFATNDQMMQHIDAAFDAQASKMSNITAINIIGTASPDGPYEENAALAHNRAMALANYLATTHSIPLDMINVGYLPEDWEGVRSWLATSTISNRDELLAIINGSADADQKDELLHTKYPAEYEILLTECYPNLRRVAYSIVYEGHTVKRDVAAESINSANDAMKRGDLNAAATYLKQAGNSAEAIYARALLAIYRGEKSRGVQLLNGIKDKLPAAQTLLSQIE
jgi:hypothetical protein